MRGIGTVIQYCTNDYRFIGRCIAEARLFSDHIVIPVSDHFFNGAPENRDLLHRTYQDHPDCTFVEFVYTPGRHYSPYCRYTPEDEGWTRLWHSLARYIGFLHLPDSVEFVFFLDCDEIPEGDNVNRWLQTGEYRGYNAIRFLMHYYVLRPTLRAKKLQDLTLLARRASLEPRFFLQTDERHGLYQHIAEPKKKKVRGEGKPLFHHYSWVRPKEECLHKAATWGHRKDRDWEAEIAKAFHPSQDGTFFGHVDLAFEEIEDAYFDPLSVPLPKIPTTCECKHVKKVSPRDVFQLELDLSYGDCNGH